MKSSISGVMRIAPSKMTSGWQQNVRQSRPRRVACAAGVAFVHDSHPLQHDHLNGDGLQHFQHQPAAVAGGYDHRQSQAWRTVGSGVLRVHRCGGACGGYDAYLDEMTAAVCEQRSRCSACEPQELRILMNLPLRPSTCQHIPPQLLSYALRQVE